MTFITQEEKAQQDFNKGRLALERFRKLIAVQYKPLLRAVTGNEKLEVEPHSSMAFTDNKTVWLPVPLALGDETLEHDKALCGQRDSATLVMLCPFCAVEDAIDGLVLHESAHITEQSFAKCDSDIVLKTMKKLFKDQWDSLTPDQQDRIENKVRYTYKAMEAAGAIDTWLPFATNIVEDIYVNRRLFEYRLGAEVPLMVESRAIFEKGIEDVKGEVTHWKDNDPSAQALISAYLVGHGLPDLASHLDPASDLTGNPDVQALVGSIPASCVVEDRLEIAMKLINCLRELGFCPPKSDDALTPPPPPMPPPDPQAEQSPPAPGEAEPSPGQGESGDDEASENDDGDDEGETGDGQAGDDEGDEESGDGEGEPSDDGDDEGEAGDGQAGSGDDDDDDEGETGDDEGEIRENLPVEPQTGDGQASDDDEGEEAGGKQGEGSDDGEAGSSEAVDGDDPSQESKGNGKGETGDDQARDDDPPLEPPTDDEIEEAAARARKLLTYLMGHEDTGPVSDDGKTAKDKMLVERVLLQEGFDHPSETIEGVVVKNRQTPEIKQVLDRAIEVKVPRNMLTASLAKMRVVFASNRKTGLQRSLKAGTRLDTMHLYRAGNDDYRIFGKRNVPKSRDWFVLVGLDFSASTGSNGAEYAIKMAGHAIGDLLHELGIPFCMYAHTSVYARGGKSLELVEIKATAEHWRARGVQETLFIQQGRGTNLDGHALEQYRKIIEESRATDKLLMYFTDGEMPFANFNEELALLKENIERLRRQRVNLIGCGYRTDSPKEHGLDTIQFDAPEDVAAIVKGLEARLQS